MTLESMGKKESSVQWVWLGRKETKAKEDRLGNLVCLEPKETKGKLEQWGELVPKEIPADKVNQGSKEKLGPLDLQVAREVPVSPDQKDLKENGAPEVRLDLLVSKDL